jgi:hypothetical protein
MHICGSNLAYDMGWLDKTESGNQVKSRFRRCYPYWLPLHSNLCFAVLMSALGNNVLVGLPQNVRILHIAQLEEVTSGRTILQEILSADPHRTRIIQEAQGLSSI